MPWVKRDYMGRPVAARGPSGRSTIMLQNGEGLVGFLDPAGQHYYWYDRESQSYRCAASLICCGSDLVGCPGDNERGGHSHVGVVVPAEVKFLRFNFAVQSFFSLWGRLPSLDQYDLVCRFFSERVLARSGLCLPASGLPSWVESCCVSRSPYPAERAYIHPQIRVPAETNDDFLAVLELNAYCELQRFESLESYTGRIPLDYEQVREMVTPDRTQPYARQWEPSGNFSRCGPYNHS